MDLEAALGAPPPAGLERHLDADERAALAATIEAACAEQAAALAEATRDAFDHVPRLLRGPVKKALGIR